MKLGLLETGKVASDLFARHGGYPDMFERLLGAADPSLRFERYSVVDGVFPDAVAACDAWLVTGSRHGVYDALPFMAPLQDFLREAYAAPAPLIGVCFGHQILASALGGEVVKWPGGWNAGLLEYALVGRPGRAAAGGTPETLALHTIHQDQVVTLPAEAQVWLRSTTSAHAGLVYGPLERPKAISVQPHPEFRRDFLHDQILARRGEGVPEAVADAAVASLRPSDAADGTDSALVADWLVAYLRGADLERVAS